MPVKNNKALNKNGEDLALEPVRSSPLFGEPPTSIPPIQSTPYIEVEVEGAAEDFQLQAEEEELASEEAEEISAEPVPQEETIFQPQDITWEYLKGLEKISLLTPEKEVELAKRIKEGERQVKIFETKTHRLKSQLYSAQVPKNGKRPQNGNGHKNKSKAKNGKKVKPLALERKEKTLQYKRALNQYQLAVLDTQKAKNEP